MRLAARGACNFDEGVEQLQDENLAAQLRKKAGVVSLKSFITATLLTGFWMIVP